MAIDSHAHHHQVTKHQTFETAPKHQSGNKGCIASQDYDIKYFGATKSRARAPSSRLMISHHSSASSAYAKNLNRLLSFPTRRQLLPFTANDHPISRADSHPRHASPMRRTRKHPKTLQIAMSGEGGEERDATVPGAEAAYTRNLVSA